MSDRRIAADLNSARLPGFHGGKWWPTTVKKLRERQNGGAERQAGEETDDADD